MTDDITEGMRTDIIGTGPIYIKKSTEYSSLKKKSRKAADQERKGNQAWRQRSGVQS